MTQTRRNGRQLREDERAIIEVMLPIAASRALRASLDNAQVVELQDGAMGSIRFLRSGGRRRTTAVAEAQYEDEDGVLVSIELNVDESGEIFELDFWKVDFSQLKRFPYPQDLRIVR